MELRKTRHAKTVTRSTHAAFLHKLLGKATLIATVFAVTAATLLLARHFGLFNPTHVETTLSHAGPWAPIALVALIAGTSFSITAPSTPLILLAGALYGVRNGTLLALTGILIGSSIAFWIARVFREPIVRRLGEHARVLQQFQRKYVTGILFVTRAVPVFSFEVMSYAAGLTSISYPQFLLATTGSVTSLLFLTTLGSFGASAAIGDTGSFGPIGLALVLVTMLFIIPLAIDHYNPFGWKDKLLAKKQSDEQ